MVVARKYVPCGKIAKVQGDGQVCMEAIYICGSYCLGLGRAAVLVHRDGDNVFSSWTEIRKENVGGDHAPRQGYWWNGGGLSAPRGAHLAQINRERDWRCSDRRNGLTRRMHAPLGQPSETNRGHKFVTGVNVLSQD